MAPGTKADFQIYDDEFWGGFVEIMQQNTDAFNDASRGTIRLIDRASRGDFQAESFIQDTAGLLTRRDTSSVAGVASLPMTQEEEIRIKINRKLGPVEQTRDAFRKIAADADSTFSFAFGRQAAKATLVDYLDTIITAGRAAFEAVGAGVVFDGTAATIDHSAIVDAMALSGDNEGQLLAMVMHSKVWFDLMKQAIVDNVWDIGSISIKEGTNTTFGRPVVVTDSPSLITVDGGGAGIDHYHTMLLYSGALTVMESEQRDIISEDVTGNENLTIRIQGELAYNAGVRGMKFDKTIENPTDAALGTPGNWTQVASDTKSIHGTMLNTL